MIENPILNPRAVNPNSGATGIMQVMPLHRRTYSATCGHELKDIRTNICFGTHILKAHLGESRLVSRGLSSYAGCKKICMWYVSKVLRNHKRLQIHYATNQRY